jgi:hypothetical protein
MLLTVANFSKNLQMNWQKLVKKYLEFIFLELTIIVISLIFTTSGTFETENRGRQRSILQLLIKLPAGFRPQDVDRPPGVVHRRRADQDDLQGPSGVDRSSRISLVATPSRPGTQSYKTILSSLKDLASSSIIFSRVLFIRVRVGAKHL